MTPTKPALYLALLHHPVRSREGTEMTTAVTNLDVHDLARLSRSYGVARSYIVTPITAQRRLVEQVLSHWEAPGPKGRIPERSEAMRCLATVPSLAAVVDGIQEIHQERPAIWATAARQTSRKTLSFAEARPIIVRPKRPILVLFGTGHGLTDSVLQQASELLAPIRPEGDYNHLSVRTAMAICLDRLIGDTLLASPDVDAGVAAC